MSWAEVKKLNSDLSTPLNLAALINHIDLVGSNYIGYGDVDGTVALLATDAIYAHEIARNILVELVLNDNPTAIGVTESLRAFKKCLEDSYTWNIVSGNSIMTDYCVTRLSASTGVGEWLAFLADSDNATLIACADMTAVVSSETAMTAVAASETAMNAIAASETAMNAIAASETAMTILDAGNKIIPDMTSNTAPEGVAAASSVYAGYYAYMLFDRGGSIFATAQGNYANQWVSYTFPNRVLVYRGEIERLGIANATPKNYILQYSEDGISWGNAASGDLPSSAGLTEFTCTRSKAVRYWRFFFPESYGTTYIHVAEAQMYGREFV